MKTERKTSGAADGLNCCKLSQQLRKMAEDHWARAHKFADDHGPEHPGFASLAAHGKCYGEAALMVDSWFSPLIEAVDVLMAYEKEWATTRTGEAMARLLRKELDEVKSDQPPAKTR